MTNFSHHAALANADTVSGVGRKYQTHSVCVHEAGPYQLPSVSLIPNAAVISDTPKVKIVTTELSIGQTVFIEGVGPHKIVADKRNPDWPRLVRQYGPRFYVEFEGFGQWTIRDCETDGAFAAIPEAIRTSLGMHKYAIKSVMEAETAAMLMSLADFRDKGVEMLPYS